MSDIAHSEVPVVGNLNTPATIAKRFGVLQHRIEYLIASRGVKAIAWAGHCRLFSDESVEFLAEELRKIDAE